MPERPQYLIDRDKVQRASWKADRDLLAQKAASSRPGQVYHTMTSLADRMTRPGYQNMQADIDQLKGLRREWNRNQKYTPQGMQVSGATTPLGAQDIYMGMSRDLRQGNKPVYNKMYPFTGAFMDYADKGGLWGAMISGIAGKTLGKAKDYLSGDGIASLADETEEDKENYITETFGPHLKNVPYGGPTPDVYEGPWPHPKGEPLLMDEEQGLTSDEQIKKLLVDPGVRSDSELLLEQWENDKQKRIDDYSGKSEEGEMVFADALPDEPLPFDQGREDFIRRQNEYVAPIPATLGTPDPQEDFANFNKYATPDIGVEFGVEHPPPLPPYDDSVRESGIMESGLNLAGRRPYEDEYRAFVESSGPSKVMVTYEDFMENYLPRIQESRGVFRAGLNSQGRR